MKRFNVSALRASAVIGLVSLASLSQAAEGDIDTTKALLYIAGGITAAGLVTGAMFGLVTLIGAAKKAMRAGT